MAFLSLRRFLGVDHSVSDDEVRANLRRRITQYCKPCWELKYCPYGPLVEDFPLPDLVLSHTLEHQEYLKACLISGKFGDGKPLDDTRRRYFQHLIDTFNPAECVASNDQLETFMSCRVFGHFCPVYFSGETATETAELRRRTRSIDRATMFRVARRDRHVCRRCGENVPDEEVEFDHIIPFSLGGDSDEDNVELTCHACNQRKKAKLDSKRFAEDPVGRMIAESGRADESEVLRDLEQMLAAHAANTPRRKRRSPKASKSS
jgi:hypothetical protein